MATAHNEAEAGQVAKSVIMPGDPMRAKFIAETYLAEPVLFNRTRGMLGYTGLYKGKRVSVMGSGMGLPSMGIYSWELFTEYDVDNIIRVGTAGAYSGELRLYDVLLVTEAYSVSTYAAQMSGYTGNVTRPSPALCASIREKAAKLGIPLAEGRVHCSDVFYRKEPEVSAKPVWQQFRDEHSCAAVEMESFALFHNAALSGKNAACLLTISDHLGTKEVTTAAEREKRFTGMLEAALETAVSV